MRKLLGVLSSLFSVSSAMFFCIFLSDLVTGGRPETANGVLAGLVVFFGGLTLMAGISARRLLTTAGAAARAPTPPMAGPAIDIALEARILALAAKTEGRITVTEIAVACAVPLADAERELDGLVARGHASLDVTPAGDTVYVVRGFLTAEQKSEAVDVVEHERT